MGLTALTSWAVQMEFAGVGGGWTDVTADVLLGTNKLVITYGIQGFTPLDRVANIGTCTFALDNSAHNSGHKLGYYSPLNTNVRSGFTWGIGVRVKFVFGGVTYYKFAGKIKEIEPKPGKKQERLTLVRCVDWMDEAATLTLQDVAVQISKRSDQLFSAALAVIPKQPLATSVATGIDTYQYAFDDLGDAPTALTIFQKIAQSELGYIFVKGDTTQGGTLVFQSRNTRILAGSTNAIDFNDDMVGLTAPRNLDMLLNRVDTIIHQRQIDAAATTVLYTQSSGASQLVSAGQSITLWATYFDPSNKLSLVGGTAMVNPVATTDYTANSAADGSGSDLTGNFTVTATFFAATAKLVIANTGGTDGYIRLLQLRGKGIYDYAPQMFRSEDTASQAASGLRAMTIDMPYQNDVLYGQGAADYLRHVYANPHVQATDISFFANHSSAFLTAALAREPGNRIGITETVTGISVTPVVLSASETGSYIQSVQFEIEPSRVGPLIWCTWGLIPADSDSVWILDQVGASELDLTTYLGYI